MTSPAETFLPLPPRDSRLLLRDRLYNGVQALMDADVIIAKLDVENGHLRKGIEDYLSGDFRSIAIRKDSAGRWRRLCAHDIEHHDECHICREAHFRDVLARADAAGVRDA